MSISDTSELDKQARRRAAREIKEYRDALTLLTNSVMACIDEIDAVMKLPSDPSRGAKVAAITNALEMANDHARYFALGIDHRTDRKVCKETL